MLLGGFFICAIQFPTNTNDVGESDYMRLSVAQTSLANESMLF
jgi:hypothetical protein